MLIKHRFKAENSQYGAYFVEFYLQLFLKFCIFRKGGSPCPVFCQFLICAIITKFFRT